MFGLFAPKCPLNDPRDKVWTEVSMQLLAQQFGIERMRNVEVLRLTPEHFPEPYQGTPDDAQAVMSRLCRHMQIHESQVVLRVCPDEEFFEAAGTYTLEDDGTGTIRVAQSKLLNLEDLLATLAHELSHQLFLGERRVSPDDAEDEDLTDLLPIFLGLGLFGANAIIRESTKIADDGEYWVIRRQGYLTSPIHGYALALFAWVRGETQPAWSESLRLDARHVFRKSLKYLIKTEDSLFHPDTAGMPSEQKPVTELINELKAASPERQIAALWALDDYGAKARSAVPEILECATRGETPVRASAINILPHVGGETPEAISCLLEALDESEMELRYAAARALGQYPEHPDRIVGLLTDALIDPSQTVALEAAISLSAFGTHAQSAAEHLVRPLRAALVRCKIDTVDVLLHTLMKVHPDPEAALAEHFADDDPEFLRRSREALKDLRRELAS